MSTAERAEPRVRPFVSWIALAVAVVLFAGVMGQAASRGHGYDLAPLPTAGRLVATGQTDHLYAQGSVRYNDVDDEVFRRAAADVGFHLNPTAFVYPPLVAFVMQPAAHVPFTVLSRVWAALSILFILAGIAFMLAAYVPAAQTPLAWAGLLVALCWFEPLRYGFWLGQTTAIIFPLLMGAVLLQRRGYPAAAGAVLALAAFVKITPLVLALVWVWRGPRRAAAACAVTLAALWAVSLAVLGPAVHAAYVARVAAIGSRVVIALNNHSALAFASRFWFPPTAWVDWQMYPPPAMASVLTLVVLAGGAVAAVLALSRPLGGEDGDRRWRRAAEGLAWTAMLIAPGIAWTHYFVFLLPVMAVVARDWPGRTRKAGWGIAGASFVMCCRAWLPAQERPMIVSGAVELARASGPTLAAVLLGAALLCVTVRRRAPERLP
jgi:hypothetical protein